MTSTSRREAVTRERIGRAALAVIDAEGTAAVTMRRVAGDLEVKAPSLYAHVKGREEILGLAHAQVMREVGPFRRRGDWRADLRAHYRRMHRVLRSHGDAASLQFGAIPTSEEALVSFEKGIDSLVEAGFPIRVAVQAAERLSLYVTADAYEQWEFERRGVERDVAEISVAIHAYAPTLAQRLEGQIDMGGGRQFDFGLDLILDGLAAQLHPTR